jgi:hypothetical protein
MSNSTLTPQGVLQDQGSLLGPCIASLFLQGLGTGLVMAQFFQWFSSPERNNGVAFSALVIFVTMVGLLVYFEFLHLFSGLIFIIPEVCKPGCHLHPLGVSPYSILDNL